MKPCNPTSAPTKTDVQGLESQCVVSAARSLKSRNENPEAHDAKTDVQNASGSSMWRRNAHQVLHGLAQAGAGLQTCMPEGETCANQTHECHCKSI